MPTLSISDIEDRSGMEKQLGETTAEYLRRVGRRTDLPPDDVEAVINYVSHQQFGPDSPPDDTTEPPIEEFLQAAAALGETDESTSEDPQPRNNSGNQRNQGSQQEQRAPQPLPLGAPRSANTRDDTDNNSSLFSAISNKSSLYSILAVLGLLIVVGSVLIIGGSQLIGTDAVPVLNDNSDETEAADQTEADEPEVVDSAAEAEGQLEVTDMAVDSSLEPEDEYIELTNTGETALDMSDWTVRDREDDGAVDARGLDPVSFPDEFVLEAGESVRIVTAPGEDTENTVHWGYDTRNWHEDGDVIIVLDGDGDEVLRHEYGTPPE